MDVASYRPEGAVASSCFDCPMTDDRDFAIGVRTLDCKQQNHRNIKTSEVLGLAWTPSHMFNIIATAFNLLT